MWDDEKIYNTARDAASRELRFIAIKETLIQMRNEDERELVECAKSNLATMARCGDLSRELEKAQRRITKLEAQLAAALATIERATRCEVCGMPAAHCRENH